MKDRPRAYEVRMIVHAAPNATVESVRSLMHDLSWVGGCRDPDEDPAFDSMEPSKIEIKRRKDLDKEKA